MATKLKMTPQQLEEIKTNNFTNFPNGVVRLIKRNKREFLVVDIFKLCNISGCTRAEFLDFVLQYEKIGWKFYTSFSSYVYFKKKRTFFVFFKSFFDTLCNIH